MTSLYGQYILAREHMGIIEKAYGFATYKIEGKTIYLRDLYVMEESRVKGLASEMADEVCEVGRKAGCKDLLGSVCPQDPSATLNMSILLKYGMRLHSASPQLILFVKEL